MDKLKRIMKRFDPESLVTKPKKKQLNIRVSEDELRSIEAIAAAVGLTVGEYLLSIHRYVLEKWKD